MNGVRHIQNIAFALPAKDLLHRIQRVLHRHGAGYTLLVRGWLRLTT